MSIERSAHSAKSENLERNGNHMPTRYSKLAPPPERNSRKKKAIGKKQIYISVYKATPSTSQLRTQYSELPSWTRKYITSRSFMMSR